MPYFVAKGRAITSARGVISGGAADSEVTWQCLCKHKDDPKAVESAKAQLPRLKACGALVEADEAPLTPREATALEARDKITEKIPLQQGTKGRQAGKLAKAQERERAEAQKQSVDLSGDPKPEPEPEPSGKGGAKRAATKPKGD